MENILKKISGYRVKNDNKWRYDLIFNQVRLLRDSVQEYNEQTLYIGYTSQSPSALPPASACLLIEDDAAMNAAYPYALLSSETELILLYDDVISFLQAAHTKRTGENRLLQALITGKGLSELVRVGAELLGNPLMVMDSAFNLLTVSTYQEQKDSSWMDFLHYGYCTHEHVALFRKRGFTRKLSESERPMIFESEIQGGLRNLVYKITIRDKIIGYISSLEADRTFSDDDIETIIHLSDVFSDEMQKTRSYDTLNCGIHESVMLKLLDKNECKSRATTERLQIFYDDHYRYFNIMAIPISRQDGLNIQVEYLRIRIENVSGAFHTVYFQGNVVVLISLRQREDLACKLENLTPLLNVNQLTCGLSFCFEDMTELEKHYREAVQAVETGHHLKLPHKLYTYDDLFLYDLLLSLDYNTKLINYCHPALGQITTYDRNFGTDYFYSLYEYLSYGGNITAVAGKLFIHRNTMVHRIAKLSEITGLDLENGEIRTQLMMSYKIIELTKDV